MADNIHKRITRALAPLPYPSRLQGVTGSDDTYITWYLLTQNDALHASDQAKRTEQVAQVSIFSRNPVVEELDTVIAALRQEGLLIGQAGPQGYDTETQYHLLPIIVRQGMTD